MKPSNQSPAIRAFIHHVMFSKGIVPLETTDVDVRRALKGISEEDARALKRKFRKIWRKQVKNADKNDYIAKKCGLASKEPTKMEKHARKQLVFNELWKTCIAPMIAKFNDLSNVPPKKEPTVTNADPDEDTETSAD